MPEATQQIRIDLSRVLPIYADEAMVISRIKAKKGEKKVAKEGVIEIVFLDQLSQPPKAISRIVVPKLTAEGLHKILGENIIKLDKELRSKTVPKQKKAETKKAEKNYLG